MNLQKIFNDTYSKQKAKFPDVFAQELKYILEHLDQTQWEGNDFTHTRRWGHDHDFGDGLKVVGTMGNRHIEIATLFQPEVKGKEVLVVGCYTGGDALLIRAMGAKTVLAIEESPLYASIAKWLSDSFEAKIDFFTGTVELLNKPGAFDVIYNAGVIYHSKYPILSLETCFRNLRPGGTMYLESMITPDEDNRIEYAGKQQPGYNWFVPSMESLRRMAQDVGFITKSVFRTDNNRGGLECKKPPLS